MKKSTVLTLTLLGLLVPGIMLAATEPQAYIAVPMKMFSWLTGKPPIKEKDKAFIYQDGKLVQCETDMQNLKKECKMSCMRRAMSPCDSKKWTKCKMRKSSKMVLLTRDQMKNLVKQKLEQKLKDLDNPDSEMSKAMDKAFEEAAIIKINGQDAKVVSPMAIFMKKDKKCMPPKPAANAPEQDKE